VRSIGTAVPILVVAAGFVVFCLVHLVRTKQVNYLPKWVWALIIVIAIPWGGIAYLIAGPKRLTGTITAATQATAAVAPVVPAASPGGGAPPRRTPSAPLVLEVAGLTKRFGPVLAVDDLSFTVPPGRVTGFLGPNGAGKTTTMRVLLGLESPTSGTALVGGRNYQDIVRPLREIGSLLDATAVHGGRTAWFHLLSLARSNGIGRRRVTELMELTGLDSVAGRPVKQFSLGMKQRLGIAAALLGDPAALILDEPINGLDPEGIRWVREFLRTLAAEGRTILVSSHLMSEMAQTADHLIVIGKGRLLADTPMEEFVSGTHRDVQVRSPRSAELAGLLTSDGAAVTADGDGLLTVTGIEASAIGDLALLHGIAVHELVPRHASLEEVYLDLTSGSTDFKTAAPTAERTAAQ
jgi:ABC-2 type transport system ATP-binding protein